MRTACTAGTFAVFTALLVAPLSPAAQNPKENQNAAAPADALTLYSAGIDALMDDPKDQGLVKALKMLQDRVLELPRELDNAQVPGPALQLALQLLMSPLSLHAGMLQNPEPGAPPFYAQLSFYGAPAATSDYAGRFSGLIAQAGAPQPKPAPSMPGLQMVDANGVPLYFGTMKGGGGAGEPESAFVLALNKTSSPQVTLDAKALPSGVKSTMAFMLDARQFQPVIDMLLGHAGEHAEQARKHLEMMGLYGPNAAQFSVAAGHAKDRCLLSGKYLNYRKVAEANGILPHAMLSAADLKRIPADASFAQISKVNFSAVCKMLHSMIEEAAAEAHGGEGGPPDPFAMIEQMTGINPQRDIADNLGETIGMYTSDSTGGGGLMSAVAFVEVKNADGLNQTMARIRGMLNQIGQQNAKGYVRIGERDLAGQKVMTLTFPGIPVPLEVCWGIADGYLYIAGSPNALQAGIQQAKSGKNNLTDNAHFKEMGGSDIKDAMKVSFLDTPRLIAGGYGLISMGMAALANAARSPTDLQRDPGIIMPSYPDLAKDAHATVMVVRLTGDDLVISGQADRSWLVNACGMLGSIGGSAGAAPVAALMAGVALPAVGKARMQARQVQSMGMLRMVGTAYATYAAEFADALPTDGNELVSKYLAPDALHSPFGPAPGGADYWLNTRGGKVSAIGNPTRYIIAYDRAMFLNGKQVAVAFLDGHVEALDVDAFRDLTQADGNQGIDFDLPF